MAMRSGNTYAPAPKRKKKPFAPYAPAVPIQLCGFSGGGDRSTSSRLKESCATSNSSAHAIKTIPMMSPNPRVCAVFRDSFRAMTEKGRRDSAKEKEKRPADGSSNQMTKHAVPQFWFE